MNKVCPQCMSSHVEVEHQLVSIDTPRQQPAKCLNCSWRGMEADLVSVPHALIEKQLSDGLNPDLALEVLHQMAQQLLIKVASSSAKQIGLALVEAGFVGQNDQIRLGRLIRASCLGAVRGAIAEAEALQKEAQNASQPS